MVNPQELGQGLGGIPGFADHIEAGAAQIQAVKQAVQVIGIDIVGHPESELMLPAGHRELIVLGVAQGLAEGPGSQGGAPEA